ncbi:single-stranded DNA-binding protein [Psittacid alphaherpesvirus 5]|uniref:Single-stranded DNA-binding protein n=1 Tax=Psittacid alphaherpesvirus 5 TaxID=2972693 RepID=A0A5P9JS87_9ALPH|nr:single-stranded DNA-binding protein [Psittacid alphaherpesvirus 5]QFU14566.1 single-stranded DNA-binding protein [Psittacid alphaherpesvirus 5]UOO01037.1 single-stranded DNA-binding protein [Psittacid alphaherpesvirus 5]
MEHSTSEGRPSKATIGGCYNPGPVGYIYARSTDSIDPNEWRLLCAKSIDQPSVALAPLIRGLVVETDFKPNIAAFIATKSSGMIGCRPSALVSPVRYAPTAYIFHGGEVIPATTRTPELTKICEEARSLFGFSTFPHNGPVPDAIETTGCEICMSIGLPAESTLLYLTIAETFRESLYLCNTYISYGALETTTISNDTVYKIPIFPIQMHMPDIALRLCANPFDINSRSIGEGCVYPRAFYNRQLNRILHGAVLGPQGVILRMRNLEALARGCAALSYDSNYTGCVLAGDKLYTQFSHDKGYRTSFKKNSTEMERRAACILAAEIALSVRISASCSPANIETIASFSDWPIFNTTQTKDERLEALGKFVAETAGIVGGAFFATNSPLYTTEVIDAGAPEQTERQQTGFTRFFLTCGLHLAGCNQVDYNGDVIIDGKEPSPMNPRPGFEYKPAHLAYACGFSPELMARTLFYLERCSRQQLGGRSDMKPLRFAAGTLTESATCDWCEPTSRIYCIRQTLHRLRSRLPIPRQPKRGPLAIIGAIDTEYTDCDILGTFAAYAHLKRVSDNEPPRAIMHDTYRGLTSRILQFLSNEGWVDRETGCDLSYISQPSDFKRVIEKLKRAIETECDRFIANLLGCRGYKYKDHIGNVIHAFTITMNPFATSYCPILSLLSEQTKYVLFQDLALSQIHQLLGKRPIETKGFVATVLPSLHAVFYDMLDNGFLNGKYEAVSLAVSTINGPDTTKCPSDSTVISYDYSLTRGKVLNLRDFKIKNRVSFNGSSGISLQSETGTKGKTQGLSEAFLRPGQTKIIDVLGGPLGFLLKRDHHQIFDTTFDVFRFWNLILTGHMPKNQLSEEAIDILKFIRNETRSYNADNFIKFQPTSLLEFANCLMANRILKYCGYGPTCGGYYISSLSAIVLSSASNKDPSAELAWLNSLPSEITAEALSTAAENSINGICRRATGDGWVSTAHVSNLCQQIMATKPVVLLGIVINKYLGQQNSSTIFQAGNWATLTGSNGAMSVNAHLTNEPVKKMLIAAKRIGTVANSSTTMAASSDGLLLNKLRDIVTDVGSTPGSIYLAALRLLGDSLRDITTETWNMITTDPYLIEALETLNSKAASFPNGWSTEAAETVGKKASVSDYQNSTEEMLSFDDCEPLSPLPQNQTTEEIDENEPPSKRHALTSDALFF